MQRILIVAVGVAGVAWLGGLGHAATDPPAACKEAKATAAGKKAADLLGAVGKNFKRPDPTRLGFSISKAQSKLTKQFSRAESKGGCATIDDVVAIEAKVDALVNDVVRAVIPVACDCCAVADRLSFTATTPSGVCGTLANFRCSNDGNAACADGTDCDFGTCIVGPNICLGNFSVMCPGGNSDCRGTCGEIQALNLPLDLECGGLYVGGGGTVLPMPVAFSDTMTLVTDVTGCNGATGALTLGPTTPVETGSALTCTAAGCRFGAPLPLALPFPGGAYSLCAVASLAEDASGSGTCDGAMSLALSVGADLYLGNDLLWDVPIDVPGVQPCPLCVRQCSGGANDRTPCAHDSDCTGGGACGAATECLGGANDTEPCAPATMDLGDAFPTSHDCLPAAESLVSQVTLDLTLSTSALTVAGPDLGDGAGAQRVFAGFCRDYYYSGSLCFEGNTSGSCAAAIPPAGGNAVACNTDADCQADTDEYESCAQRTAGAFSEAAATRMTLAASAPGQCLADGLPRAATLAAAFGFPPTFANVIDAFYDWPGPGAVTIAGDVTLRP